MNYDTILYEVDDRIATITFNRPDQLNALSPHMIGELRAAYAAAEADESVWITIVTGTGRAFCAGADVTEIPGDGRVVSEDPYLSTYEQWEAPQEGTPPFRTMTKPVLTAVNGLYLRDREELKLGGGITVTTSDGYKFTTPSAQIDLHRSHVVGRQPIHGAGPAGNLAADQFEIRQGGDVLQFQGRVKVIVQPRSTGDPSS